MMTQQVEFPADFAEKFQEFFPEHDSVDDVLQYQVLKTSPSSPDYCRGDT